MDGEAQQRQPEEPLLINSAFFLLTQSVSQLGHILFILLAFLETLSIIIILIFGVGLLNPQIMDIAKLPAHFSAGLEVLDQIIGENGWDALGVLATLIIAVTITVSETHKTELEHKRGNDDTSARRARFVTFLAFELMITVALAGVAVLLANYFFFRLMEPPGIIGWALASLMALWAIFEFYRVETMTAIFNANQEVEGGETANPEPEEATEKSPNNISTATVVAFPATPGHLVATDCRPTVGATAAKLPKILVLISVGLTAFYVVLGRKHQRVSGGFQC